MSGEAALLQVLQRTAPVPGPLALGAQHDPFGIRAHPARTPQPTAHRQHPPIRAHLHGPAPEETARVIRPAQPERHPDVSLRIVLRAKGEFVAFGVPPVVGQGLVAVRDLIPIKIGDAGDLSELRDCHRAVPPGQAEDLILPARKEMILRLGRDLKAPLMK